MSSSKTMKAILLDAAKATVEYVEVNNLDDIDRLLECAISTGAGYLRNGDACYVDDIGLMYEKPPMHFLKMEHYWCPFATRALVVGYDINGNRIDCRSTTMELAETTQFMDLRQWIENGWNGKHGLTIVF